MTVLDLLARLISLLRKVYVFIGHQTHNTPVYISTEDFPRNMDETRDRLQRIKEQWPDLFADLQDFNTPNQTDHEEH